MAGEWRKLPFSQAVTVNPRVQLTRGATYPFVDMGAVSAGSRSAYASEQRQFDGGGSRFAVGDTLMARITPCLENGKIARFAGLPGEIGHGSTEFIVIRGRDGVSDTDYAYYLTKWEGVSGYAISQMTGTSGRQRVPSEALDHLKVLLPPLPEQRAIAHILGTLDDKIELNRKQNETLEAMARALFKAWFVDFEPVRAKMEGRWQRGQSLPGLPAHLYDLFPDRLVDSELGEIPEEWGVISVADVGKVICGKTPSTAVPEYYGDEIPFITIPDMHGKIFATKTQKKLSRSGASSQKNKMLPAGAICVSCIATVGLVVITTEESQTNQQINAVIPKNNNETYFWLWILRDLGDEIRAGGSGGSVLTNLSTGRFSQLRVLAPPSRIRRSYHLLVAELFQRILANENQSSTLAALRDTLLPKLISGELRVADAERIVGAAV